MNVTEGFRTRDSEQVKAAVAQAEAEFGAVDVLVNNAGHG
ncbi:SDR family NAD(P)-dependent oxidoreductase [Roseiarcus sp.]